MTPSTIRPDCGTRIDSGNESGQWFVAEFYNPNFVVEVEKSLNELAALQAGWDGEDAPAIHPNILNAAREFAKSLPANLAPTPHVVPMARGNLQFEWRDGGRSLELEFEGTNRIHYLKWDPNSSIEEEAVIDIRDIERATDLIRWIAGGTVNV